MATQQMIMLGLIIVVFYFFMIRPQVKKQKDQKKFADDLKKGDRVVLTSGAHGKISEIATDGATILVEHESGQKIRYDKSAISLESSKALNAPVKV
jgi:preprotein translocase subunit YajC